MSGSLDGGEPDKMAEAIRPLLADSDGEVSKAATTMLCHLGDEQTLLSLITPTPKPAYRTIGWGLSIASWSRRKHESVARRALTFFDSKDPELVAFAVGFFALERNPIAKTQMLALLDSESADVRAQVVGSLLSYCERAEAARLVTKKLDDPDEEVRRQAWHAASDLRMEIKANTILPHLKDRNPHSREMACNALRTYHDPEVVDALLEATRDREPRSSGRGGCVAGGK